MMVCGKPCRAWLSDSKSQLFIANLPRGISYETLSNALVRLAGPFVTLELKNGYAFVTYTNVWEAESAMKKLRGQDVEGKAIAVELAGKKQDDRERGGRPSSTTKTLYINGLAPTVTEETVRERFSIFGTLMSCTLVRDHEGKSRGYGFVQYLEPSSAARARENLHNKELEGSKLGVFESKPKNERGAAALASVYPPRTAGYPPAAASPYDYFRLPPLDDRLSYSLLSMYAQPAAAAAAGYPPAAAPAAAPATAPPPPPGVAQAPAPESADPYAAYASAYAAYPYAYDPAYAAAYRASGTADVYGAARTRDATRAAPTRPARYSPY
eukprot:TRINITY_DN927_c0_g2_i2.p1 TRINITY_DN927_c0_g2~~TRINITY_DN927_c0_g2_i2.p1  ORF type:complete len:326 (+),score=142.71 TRINITY_DN927_c0_g2_i2:518-1495(+)